MDKLTDILAIFISLNLYSSSGGFDNFYSVVTFKIVQIFSSKTLLTAPNDLKEKFKKEFGTELGDNAAALPQDSPMYNWEKDLERVSNAIDLNRLIGSSPKNPYIKIYLTTNFTQVCHLYMAIWGTVFLFQIVEGASAMSWATFLILCTIIAYNTSILILEIGRTIKELAKLFDHCFNESPQEVARYLNIQELDRLSDASQWIYLILIMMLFMIGVLYPLFWVVPPDICSQQSLFYLILLYSGICCSMYFPIHRREDSYSITSQYIVAPVLILLSSIVLYHSEYNIASSIKSSYILLWMLLPYFVTVVILIVRVIRVLRYFKSDITKLYRTLDEMIMSSKLGSNITNQNTLRKSIISDEDSITINIV